MQILEYVNSVDEGLLSYVEHVQNNPQSAERYMLDDMSERAANDIREKVGIDVRGFKTTIEPRIVEHIIRDHGENGLADHSMADTNDIARIQYVLNNYDTVVDGGTSSAYTEPKPNYPGKNRKAKTVVFEKKIDGFYYVVEAVPVTKAKTAYVTSAYINTNKKGNQPTLNAPDGTPGFTSENVSLSSLAGDVTQVPNAAAATPSGTPEASLASPSPLNTSIQQNAENSNGLGTKTVNTMQDAMQYGKTPEQAVMEARAKAEGEKFSAGVNANGSINGDTDTAYSIGLIDKRNHPSSDGSSNSPFGSGAHTQMTSDNSISPNAENGNTDAWREEG